MIRSFINFIIENRKTFCPPTPASVQSRNSDEATHVLFGSCTLGRARNERKTQILGGGLLVVEQVEVGEILNMNKSTCFDFWKSIVTNNAWEVRVDIVNLFSLNRILTLFWHLYVDLSGLVEFIDHLHIFSKGAGIVFQDIIYVYSHVLLQLLHINQEANHFFFASCNGFVK